MKEAYQQYFAEHVTTPEILKVTACKKHRVICCQDCSARAETDKKFFMEFSARLAGALGSHSKYERYVFAKDKEDARLKLYTDFEHIYVTVCEEIPANE